MNINPTRYILTVKPKEDKPHNSILDAIQGSVCSILDMRVGYHGWIMTADEYDYWHRVRTSIVESITTESANNETTQIIVVTQNSVYTFKKIEENT